MNNERIYLDWLVVGRLKYTPSERCMLRRCCVFICRRVHLLATVQSCAITINTHHMYVWCKDKRNASSLSLWPLYLILSHHHPWQISRALRTHAQPNLYHRHCKAECIINEAIFFGPSTWPGRRRRVVVVVVVVVASRWWLAVITRMCQRTCHSHTHVCTHSHTYTSVCAYKLCIFYAHTRARRRYGDILRAGIIRKHVSAATRFAPPFVWRARARA